MGRFDKLIAKTQQSLIDGVFAEALNGEEVEIADTGPRLAPPDARGIQLFYRASAGSRLRGQKQVMTGAVLTATRLLWCDVNMGGLGSVRKFTPAKDAAVQEWTREGLEIHITRPSRKDKIYAPNSIVVEFTQSDDYVSVYCTLDPSFWESKLA